MKEKLPEQDFHQSHKFKLERNVIGTGFTSFFTDTATKMIYSVMPMFLLSLGASASIIALIEGIAESTASILKAFSGYISDKQGRCKPFMILGYGLAALTLPLYVFVTVPIQVLGIRFTERIGKGIRAAPRDSLISNSISKKTIGRSFGFQSAMDNSGAVLGPLLAMAVLYFFPYGYKYVFALATIPALIGVLCVVFLIKDVKIRSRFKKENAFKFKLLPKKYYQFLLVVFIFSLGNSSDALLLVKAASTNINPVFIPFIYMIFNTTAVLVAMPIGKLSDLIGRAKLMALGFCIYGFSYLGFGYFCNIFIFIPVFILYGIYFSLADVSQKSLIADITTRETKGIGYGLYHATVGLTLLPASCIGGWLYDNVNNAVPFYFGAATALLASVLMFVFFYRETRA